MYTRKWKQLVGLSCAALIVALPACSAETGAEPGSDAVTVWFPGNDESEMKLVNETLVPQFEEATGADVEVTFVDWANMSPKLNTAFAAGTAPDVFGHGVAATADLVNNDRLEDLTPRVDQLDPADVEDLSQALPGGEVGGQQFTMPLLMTLNLMVYSGADFTEAGLDPDKPPTTWEEARTVAQQLTERSGDEITRSGMTLPSQPINSQQTFATLLWANGGDLLTEDESASALTSPEAVGALDYYTSLYQGDQAVDGNLGVAWSSQPSAQQPVVTGKAAMQFTSVSSVAKLQQAAPDRDIRMMNPLSFAGKEPAAFGGAANGLMMNKDSEHKDLAWKFIEFMISEEISTKYATDLGFLPIRQSASESEAVQSNPVFAQTLENLQYAHGNPNVPGWVQMRDKLDQSLERSLRGTQPPADALAQAAGDTDAVLAANR